MGFYDFPKTERLRLMAGIHDAIAHDLEGEKAQRILGYFADEDTNIRKTAYLAIGKIYNTDDVPRHVIITTLEKLLAHEDYRVRQTVINAVGEIGKTDFIAVKVFFDAGLFDPHHTVPNAVIGSVKKMGQKTLGPHSNGREHICTMKMGRLEGRFVMASN